MRIRELEKLFGNFDNIEDEAKIFSLHDAVKTFVKPGMHIHIAAGRSVPHAAAYELIRCFRGTAPGFTVSSLSAGIHVSLLVAAGMVKKVIAAYPGDLYPFPRPSPVITRAADDGSIVLALDTALDVSLRTFAGALDLDFIQTTALRGTTLAKDCAAYTEITHPFSPEKTVGVVESIRPDIAFVHALCADSKGNAIIPAPHTGGFWGALASTGGIIVLAEKLVNSDYVKQQAEYVHIPEHKVVAVVECPLAAHPCGMRSIDDYSYDDDHGFFNEFYAAAESAESLSTWMTSWIYDIPEHRAYVEKLGNDRIIALISDGHMRAWHPHIDMLLSREDRANSGDPTHSQGMGLEKATATTQERMIIAAARHIASGTDPAQNTALYAGAGVAHLAAALAHYACYHANQSVPVMTDAGCYGYGPIPGSPFTMTASIMHNAKALSESLEAFGGFFGGSRGRHIAVITAAEVAADGTINATKTVDGYVAASPSIADAVVRATATVALVPATSALVDAVSYVTARAPALTVVTPDGLFETVNGTLTLTGVFADEASKHEAVAALTAQIGASFAVADTVAALPEPEQESLIMLRIFDPEKIVLKRA